MAGVVREHFDVGICGAGPAGLTLSCYLAQAGYKVAVCEQQAFPRHQIGESLLPFSRKIFEEIGFEERLAAGQFIKKFGAAFHSERSQAACSFLFKDSLSPQYPYIYHVPRETFDLLLLQHAQSLGVTVFQPHRVQNIVKSSEHVAVDDLFTCDLIVQASGIANASRYPDSYIANDDADNRTALYSYYKYTPRSGGERDGDILIDLFYDDAASRMPNWAWAIPISTDIMSVGYVMPTTSFAAYRKGRTDLDAIGAQLLGQMRAVRNLLDDGQPLEPHRLKFNFQRVCRQIVFDREMFIGDAAGFIDPVFSSGVHIGLNSAKMAFETIAKLGRGSDYSAAELAPFETRYHTLFWTYYRFVKMFYEKNLVENFFLVAQDPMAETHSRALVQQFTSILSGDVATPNALVDSLYKTRIALNPKIAEVFKGYGPRITADGAANALS